MDWKQAKIIFKSEAYEVTALPYTLLFKFPFRLAVGSRDCTETVLLCIKSAEESGFGEAALPPYLGETVADVLAFYQKLDWQRILHLPILEAIAEADQVTIGNNAAKASLDIALHDIHCQKYGLSISQFYQVSAAPVLSTYTIGISQEGELREKLTEAAPFRIIKLKLGSDDDKALVQNYLALSDKPFCVDVNQGWKNREQAASICTFLSEKGVLFIEQPLPVEQLDDMEWLKARFEIPFIADEAVKRRTDLAGISQAFDGVNIKLMKSTGLAEAYAMINQCRSLKLKVVLGAMAESSCGATAAAHLAPLADWVDLDAPFLIKNDPLQGIHYEHGLVKLPEGIGSGARLRI